MTNHPFKSGPAFRFGSCQYRDNNGMPVVLFTDRATSDASSECAIAALLESFPDAFDEAIFRATTIMFARFRRTRHRLQVSLVETRRVGGKVRHEHVAGLGSIETPPSVDARLAFWVRLHQRLAIEATCCHPPPGEVDMPAEPVQGCPHRQQKPGPRA